MNTTIRRSGLVAGLALLMSFATATPASAIAPAISHDLGAGPIKVAASTSADGDQATILFSISGIPEPAAIGIIAPFLDISEGLYGAGDIGRNETTIALTTTNDPMDLQAWDSEITLAPFFFGLMGRQLSVTSTAKPLNRASIPTHGVAAVGEKVSHPTDVDIAIGRELMSVDWGDGSTPDKRLGVLDTKGNPLQFSHIYQKTGFFDINFAWTNLDGTKEQEVEHLTVVPAGTSIVDRYGSLIQDLAFSKGQNVISGSIELTYDTGNWQIKDMLLRSPDGRLQADRMPGGQGNLNNDGETYLNVSVQSVGENCWPPDEDPATPDFSPNVTAKADANGYVPCGLYHLAVPITVPAAPVASASPSAVPASVAPATPAPSASPVVTPTDQGGTIINQPFLGLGSLLFISLVLFIAFRLRRRRRDRDWKEA